MSSSPQEFLFFDTIAHDGEIDQVLQVDEIKFELPVYIDEIRVLPLGFHIATLDKLSVSNSEKPLISVGATKPMPCELEFFGKNLNIRSNRDRVRYRRLGKKLFRDETDMVYIPRLSIPTDSLIIKGKYDTLTMAVIGVLARPKSPPARHEPTSMTNPIVNVLLSAPQHNRPHPMDTLPLAASTNSNAGSNSFSLSSHPSPAMDNPTSSNNHNDGIWVAPPELQNKQLSASEPDFSHLQATRPVPNFVQPLHSRLHENPPHEYNQTSGGQQMYLSNRTQSSSNIHPRHPLLPTYSSSEYNHVDKSMDEGDEKQTRMPLMMQSTYRSNQIDQMGEDPKIVPNITGHSGFLPLMSQLPYSHENQRRSLDPISNSTNNSQEVESDGDSYLSDDNTSESDTSGVHNISFNEDEQQAFQRDALYNARSSIRLTALKMFHSPIKSLFEIETIKFHDDSYRVSNEEFVQQLRTVLKTSCIDHCRLEFLELLEAICLNLPIGLAGLESDEELQSAIECLSDWSLKLINIQYIMSKQFIDFNETLFKIRILKCGIRLAGHLSVLTDHLSSSWIKRDVQSKLMDLYDDQLISPSVKLLIIKALDQSMFFKCGLLWFTGQSCEFPLLTHASPYFRLVEKLQMGNEIKQVTESISCLLRKVHLYEEFFSFQLQIKNLTSSESASLTLNQAEQYKQILDDLLISLSAIRDTIVNASDLITQEKSWGVAPCQSSTSLIFSKIENFDNAWPYILRWMIDTDFLKSITVLIHLCILHQRQDLFNVIENLFREFFNSFDGLIFLTNQTTTPNGLLKAFYFAETKFEDVNKDPVGPQLMCAFQTLNCIDELKSVTSQEKLDMDDSELLQILHRLLSLILFHHHVRKLSNKRQIIVHVLAMESNFDCIIKLIESINDVESLKSSIRIRYVARIIYEVFSKSDSVTLLERYGPRLLEICERHSNQRLVRVRQWLFPLSKMKYFDHSQETAVHLISELKTYLQESIQSGELVPGLMTIVRLIQYLTIPPEQQFVVGAKIELKYDYMMLKFYSSGIYSLLIRLLEKCADSLMRFWQIGLPLNMPKKIIIYGTLIPTLIIFRTLMQKLMSDRKSKFVDVTPIRALLSIYATTLCASLSTDLTDVDIIRSNLMDTILAYNWSIPSDSEPVTIGSCGWTLVLQEILRLISESPHSMISGLCLLTELLPIPLPHTVRQPLSNSQCSIIKDDFHRYHAVLHLIWTQDTNSRISKIIQSLCHTSNTIMQEILRRLCLQLIDLGPKLARLVMKMLMDELISIWKTNQNETTKAFKSTINESGRLVAILAALAATRSGKCTLLSLLNSFEEKYSTMIKDLLEYLHTRAESNEICLCQEATMSIIQTLCDANLYLSLPKSDENSLQFLANTLPNENLISIIITNIVRLLSPTEQQRTWTQITMALRTLISLADHDFGSQLIQKVLVENRQVFISLIADFDLRFDKEQPDFLEAVSSLMVLLQRLLIIDLSTDSPFKRTHHFPLKLFRELLGASTNNENKLENFITLINTIVNDDSSGNHDNGNKTQNHGTSDVLDSNEDDQQCFQTLQKILERANSIIQEMRKNDNISDFESTEILILPKPETIETQFQNRLVYILVNDCTDDQRNVELYWLGIPPPALLDDVDYGQDESSNNLDEINDRVKCDLEDLIVKYCSGFNFVNEYKSQVIDHIKRKRKSSSKKRSALSEPVTSSDTKIIQTVTLKNPAPWSAPMRGNTRRNFRAANTTVHTHNYVNGNQRRIDHFRTRPLNTSRPPSMHVDDFEKQFHEHGNGSSSANTSSTTNNNINENNNNDVNKGNELDMPNSMKSSSDANNSDRERWPRRGMIQNFRISQIPHQRYPFSPTPLSFPGSYGFRGRLAYPYAPSRYATFDMDFVPPYFPHEELFEERPYDYYPNNIQFDSHRHRGHYGHFDPSGYH